MSVMQLEKEFFVHTSMVGKNDYIRPAAIMDLFQDMASLHANEIGVGFDDIVKLNYYWIVSSIEFEQLRQFKSISYVKVKTWPKEKNRLEFIREFTISDLDGNLLVKGVSTWVLIDKDTRRLVRGDDVIFKGEYSMETNYPNYRRRKIPLLNDNVIKEWDYKVLATDLDHNGHMNNARYADIIYNGLFDDRSLKNLHISFLHEALLNDNIHVSYYKNDSNTNYYIGKIDDKVCFEICMEVND